MTDAPLSLTIYPAAIPSSGRSVNPNPTSGFVSDNGQFWGGDGLSFKGILDIVNPLQHIPIVSTLYQAMTGDQPSSGANLAGGALYGGPVGFASALFNEIVKAQTGNDIGGNMLAMIEGKPAAQMAENTASFAASPADAPSPANQAAYAAYRHTQSLLA